MRDREREVGLEEKRRVMESQWKKRREKKKNEE